MPTVPQPHRTLIGYRVRGVIVFKEFADFERDNPPMNGSSANSVRTKVRQAYAAIAVNGKNVGCCQPAPTVDGRPPAPTAEDFSQNFGYPADDPAFVPDGSNMGLGCGNPMAIASLREGEVVLDLGSGGGFDCFLAAKKVGDGGRVISVDMTPEMLAKDRGMLYGCTAGATKTDDLAAWLADAGLSAIRITVEEESRDVIKDWALGTGVEAIKNAA